MGCRVLRHHNWGYSVCLCPIKRTPVLYGLTTIYFTSITQKSHGRWQRWASLWENLVFAYAKTKTQISCAVTAQLISAFVFAIRIVQSLKYLNPKFQASSHLLWLYSPVCVGPGRKPRIPIFSQRGSGVLTWWRKPENPGKRTDLWRLTTTLSHAYTRCWTRATEVTSECFTTALSMP